MNIKMRNLFAIHIERWIREDIFMRLQSIIKSKIFYSMVLVAAILVITLASLGNNSRKAYADVSLGGPQNCDANAVMYCGAASASQVTAKYNNGDGVNNPISIHNIYSYFQISNAEVQSLSQTAVAGTVTSSGNVYVGNKLVATQAISAGRQNISGSTYEVWNGTGFYVRPTQVSFVSSPLSAYVVMNNGKFLFAILSSCGNPIAAKPVLPPPSPAGVCTNLSLGLAGNNPDQVNAKVNYTVTNGASLKSVTYNWGDGTSITSQGAYAVNASHLYAKAGSYLVIAKLSFNGPTAVPSVSCQAPITASTISSVCSQLDVSSINNDTVNITGFNYSNNNGPAVFKYATVNWGDQTANSTASNIVGLSHTYSSLTPHTIIATAYFNENGQTVGVSSPTCQHEVTFIQPVQTISTPPTPTQTTPPTTLTNTGPGSAAAILGAFSIVSVVGSLLYRRHITKLL